jgi:flagellar FliL protein
MKDENKAESQNQNESPGEDQARQGVGAVIGAVVAAAVLGVAVGGLVIGPRIAGGSSEATASPGSSGHPEAAAAGNEPSEGKFFELENLVVNPAGSRGERFLMVSVAFEVPDDETVNQLHEREVQVRDVVSATLESQTMETLTREGAREDLKRQLGSAIARLAGDPTWIRVYIPRLVIQ